MDDLQTGRCSYCGAVRRGDFPCPSCGAEVPKIRCTRCSRVTMAGTERCACGARLVIDRSAGCPRCQCALERLEMEGRTMVLQCTDCRGCFLRLHAWSEILDRASLASTHEIAHFLPPDPARPLPRQVRLESVRCPDCNRVMDRARFGVRSDVVVDICNMHGIWVDAGELQAAMTFVKRREQNGGRVAVPKEQQWADEDFARAIAARRAEIAKRDARIDAAEQRAERGWLPPHVRIALAALDKLFGE